MGAEGMGKEGGEGSGSWLRCEEESASCTDVANDGARHVTRLTQARGKSIGMGTTEVEACFVDVTQLHYLRAHDVRRVYARRRRRAGAVCRRMGDLS